MEWNEQVGQNLKDAGCDEATIRAFREISQKALPSAARSRSQEKLLAGYRKSLLDQLHRDQFRLDCLDYLLFHLRNPEKGEAK